MKRILMFVGASIAAVVVVVGVSIGTVWLVKDSLVGQRNDGAQGREAEIEVTKANVLPLKPFVTNLADTGGAKYISVTFELVLRKPADGDKLNENLPLIRDHIVAVLSSKRSQEVTGEAGANTLKNDVLLRLNEKLGGTYIQKVLITDLVVQH